MNLSFDPATSFAPEAQQLDQFPNYVVLDMGLEMPTGCATILLSVVELA